MKWASAASRDLASPFKRSVPRVTTTIKISEPKQGYTTWDLIEGTITVTVNDETAFDNINITFEGSSRVSLLRPITLNQEIKASHTFLTMQQHIDKAEYHTSRTFAGARCYTYPFKFVIPGELPMRSCIHNGDEASVPKSHAELPPTMHLENDSQLCRISYLIHATVFRKDVGNGANEEIITASTRNMHFTPTFPCSIQAHSPYEYSIGHDVEGDRKSPALGRLTLVAPAARVGQYTALKHSSATNLDTCIYVQLRFDPVGDAQPPRLRTLYSTLQASTTFNAKLDAGPRAVGEIALDPRYEGAHVKTTSLPSIDVSSIRWVKYGSTRSPGSLGSQYPFASSSNTREPINSSSYGDGLYYTASIIIPIVQPGSNAFLPTFHSCLVSRTYLLDLNLSYCLAGATRGRRAMKLQIPIEFGKTCDQDGSRLAPQCTMGGRLLPSVNFHLRRSTQTICLGILTLPPERNDRYTKAPSKWQIVTHYEGIKPLIASGRLVAGGAMLQSHPGDGEDTSFKGSMIIYTGESVEDVRSVIMKDIYAKAGVWDLEKVQIIPYVSAIREPMS
ncbi:hypothetical protein CNMCM8927_008598 [Aspergillus lentulus]|uniref:Arrestin-like N-terminal domain-containing protein n=1 Tax=Aspergillus lentulus TaxID=293939 RepID=A0AAN6BP05_ASPLE|nr:hypothetical protein CNMCM6069_007847 [Aspergillus lentulus]KAF4203551.1 hypothetical protein CNMCM8927_008598 [Aspergillus lentulus]